jgi:hypothetical protein
MNVTEWIRWGITGLVAAAYLYGLIRRERAHKKEIAAKDAAVKPLKHLAFS